MNASLEQTLAADSAQPRATPLDALRVARRTWVADQRINMGGLAIELGVSRATLYNWVGDRELLTAEVLWSMASETTARARERAHGSGAEFLSAVIEHYLTALAAFDPIRRFIARDPEFALRVLTSRRTPFQRRLIDTLREMIEEQIASDRYQPPLEPDTLAYVLVRIGESLIFNDAITETEPDLRKAVQASSVLLHAPPVAGAG